MFRSTTVRFQSIIGVLGAYLLNFCVSIPPGTFNFKTLCEMAVSSMGSIGSAAWQRRQQWVGSVAAQAALGRQRGIAGNSAHPCCRPNATHVVLLPTQLHLWCQPNAACAAVLLTQCRPCCHAADPTTPVLPCCRPNAGHAAMLSTQLHPCFCAADLMLLTLPCC